MGMFDFLTGANVDPEGYAGPQNKFDEFANTSGGGAVEGFFADPNMQRLLGDIGSRISQGQEVGQALGEPTGDLVRRQAAQKTGGSLMEQVLNAMKKDPTGKNILGPKDDLGTLNGIKITDDKISFDMPNASKTQPFSIGAEKPLEAIKSFQAPEVPEVSDTSNVRQDLRDFFNAPSDQSLAGVDLRGLDPEDVNAFVKQAMGVAQFKDTREARKAKALQTQRALQQAAEQAKIKREQELADIETRQTGKIDLEREKARLKKEAVDALTERERNRAKAELAKIEQQTSTSKALEEKYRKDPTGRQTTPGEQLAQRKYQNILTKTMLDEKTPFEIKKAFAQESNSNPNASVYYKIKEEVEDAPGIYTLGPDIPGEIIPIQLPKNPKTNKQITSQEITDTAEAYGMTPEELLIHWRIISPKGVR